MARISLGTNISALQAGRSLSKISDDAARVFERLSSGLRINRASDDAAGLAIVSGLTAKSRVYAQGVRNINDGLSVLSIADSTLAELSSITTRIRELATQAANGAYSAGQRQALDTEAQALSDEFFRVSRSASFNGLNLFDGSLSDGLRLQFGFGTDGGISSLLGGALGTGRIQELVTRTDGGNYTAAAVTTGDLNGDGLLDLVTGGGSPYFAGGTISISLGTGGGGFSAPTVLSPPLLDESNAVELADFNNDGILDIVSAGYYSVEGRISVWMGEGDGTFQEPISFSPGDWAYDLAVGDLNGDGHMDIATATGDTYSGYDSYPTFAVVLGNGDGTFRAAVSVIDTSQSYSSTISVALGDLNGDGILDLISTGGGYTDPNVTVRLGNGDGTFAASRSSLSNSSWNSDLAIGDVNGDGRIDVITVGYDGDDYHSVVEVRLGQGDGTLAAATSFFSGLSSYYTSVVLGDLNGDGVTDVTVGGSYLVQTWLGRGDGTFTLAATAGPTTGASDVRAVTVADVTGDGVLDVLTGGDRLNIPSYSIFAGITRDGVSPLLEFNLETRASALQSFGMLDRTLTNLAAQRGAIGAFQSRLGSALASVQASGDNHGHAASRIRDADMAEESSRLASITILREAAAAVLAQANQSPALAVSLLSA